jgi:hypothetical protein
MIPYEELVAALDRYVARNGGSPQSAHMPASASSYAPGSELPSHEVSMNAEFDEPGDPDMGSLAHSADENTHVGGSLPATGEEHASEIDLGDVLTDDEL